MEFNFDRPMDLYFAIVNEIAVDAVIVVHYFAMGCRCVGVYICHLLCLDICHQIYKLNLLLIRILQVITGKPMAVIVKKVRILKVAAWLVLGRFLVYILKDVGIDNFGWCSLLVY